MILHFASSFSTTLLSTLHTTLFRPSIPHRIYTIHCDYQFLIASTRFIATTNSSSQLPDPLRPSIPHRIYLIYFEHHLLIASFVQKHHLQAFSQRYLG